MASADRGHDKSIPDNQYQYQAVQQFTQYYYKFLHESRAKLVDSFYLATQEDQTPQSTGSSSTLMLLNGNRVCQPKLAFQQALPEFIRPPQLCAIDYQSVQ
ncbi:MAG: hypothetical protein MHPSP_002413, partial [Paramarteilia canceri]